MIVTVTIFISVMLLLLLLSIYIVLLLLLLLQLLLQPTGPPPYIAIIAKVDADPARGPIKSQEHLKSSTSTPNKNLMSRYDTDTSRTTSGAERLTPVLQKLSP